MKTQPALSPLPAAVAGALAAALLAAPALRAQTVTTWNGGAGNWSDNTRWDNGVPNSTAADARVDGGKTATASNVTVDGGYSVGRLTVDAGDTVAINSAASAGAGGERGLSVIPGAFTGAGTLNNNGLITLNATGAYFGTASDLVNLRADNTSLSLTGNGTVQMTDSTNNRIFGNSLSFGAGQTVRGGAQIFANTIANAGLLDGTGATLGIVLSPTIALTNTGTLRASAGGLLTLNGGTTNNAGGTIAALAGSTVRLDNGVNVTGGTLSTSGTGVINVGAATISNLTNIGTISVAGPGQPTLNTSGTITNNGRINVTSTGGVNDLYLAADTTLNGGLTFGRVTLAGPGSNNNARIFGASGTRLTNGVNHTIEGRGQVGAGFIAITNNGTINANDGVLDITPANVANAFINGAAGRVIANNGGIATLNSNGAGQFTNNGFFQVFGGGQINVAPGALTNFSGTTLTGGFYVLSAAASTPATLSLGGGSIVTNKAFVQLAGAGAVFTEFNALADNQGVLELEGDRNFTTAGALTNSGKLSVGNNSTLTVTGALTQSAAGQILGNRGTISAPTLTLDGALRPGDFVNTDPANSVLPFVGFLTLAGQVNLSDTSVFFFDLGTLAASDRLQINGGLTLDGTFNVTARAGFGLGTYDLIDYTGALTNNVLDIGSAPAGYTYAIDLSTAGQVNLVVSAVPEPSTYALALGGFGLLLCAQRARRRTV